MRDLVADSPPSGASSQAPTQYSNAARSAFEPRQLWKPGAGRCLPNALTCDVEDYFQVSAFEHLVAKSDWSKFECRIPRNVDRVLQLMSDAGVAGTFFTLGWVAERFPEVVRRIAESGHEIASHGMHHKRIWSQQPDEFRNDIVKSKKLLEDVAGTPVRGYRAASWSMDARTPWAYSLLGEAGYQYSSSIYPVAHDHYGMPDAPVAPFYVRSADVLEIPASTARLAGRNWPAAGGGYFRLLPLSVSLWLLGRAKQNTGAPAVFYFHPWELDPKQPRMMRANGKARLRHYINLHKTEPRLRVLMKAFAWDRMDRIFGLS